MKKAALFPFCANVLPIVRYFGVLQNEYELVKVVALPGMGLAGHDVAYVCNQEPLDIKVFDEIFDEDDKWDSLILIRMYLPTDYDIKNVICKALECEKEVVLLEHSSALLPHSVIEITQREPGVHLVSVEDLLPSIEEYRYYTSIKTPVMLIGGLEDQADVFEVVVAATEKLKNMGLSVATITKESAGALFGFYDFSSFLFKNGNMAENIVEINQKLQWIEQKLMPDIMVIEAPDAVIRYNDIAPNGFGIYTYILCQAVQPDYFVCCMPYDVTDKRFISLLSEDFKVRLGASIDMVHASNLVIDSLEVSNSRAMSTFYMDYQSMQQVVNEKNMKEMYPY